MSDTPETDANEHAWAFFEQYGYESSLQDAPVDRADFARRLERERDSLKEQLDAALMLGKMQERRHERELKDTREQYRLSSVCRGMQAQIDMLQKIVTAYELEKEKQDEKRP